MAKQNRNKRQNERRAQNKQGWQALGIHDKIISRLSLRDKNPNTVPDDFKKLVKTQSRTQKARETKACNMKQRESVLRNAGFKKSEIKKQWLTSDNYLYNALGRTNPNKVYKSKEHLALCFTPVNGAEFVGTAELKNLSFEEIKNKIHKRVKQAKRKPKSSADISCVFQMFHGSESECDRALDIYNQRGYNLSAKKLTDRRYYSLLNRNDWTMREYAEMVYTVISQAHNRDVPMLIDQFQEFISDAGLPFDEIFQ